MNFKQIILFLIIAILLAGGAYYFFQRPKQSEEPLKGENSSEILSPKKIDKIKTNNMEIKSPEFQNGQYISSNFTCDGENINPVLEINKVPDLAKSLVLIVDDPDAPMGLWIHWTVWNINPKTAEISEGSIPEGAIEGMTSFGRPGYGGPCPPNGTHRYFFKLYALDKELELSRSAGKEDIEKAMAGHVLSQAQLIGLYKRK